MLKPCANAIAAPSFRFGSISSVVDPLLVFVRRQQHDEISAFGCLRHGLDVEAGILGLGPRAGSRTQANGHTNARVAQVVGVGVALGSIADHRHVHLLDDGKVGILVVVDLHRCTPRSNYTLSIFSARPIPDTPDLTTSRISLLVQRAYERVEFLRCSGELDRIGIAGHVDDLPAEDVAAAFDLLPLVGDGANLDQHQFPFEVVAVGEIHDLDHFDQPVQMLDDLFDPGLVAGGRQASPGTTSRPRWARR